MTDSAPGPADEPDASAEVVLTACRALVAMAARSIAAVEDQADVLQVRVLVVIASRGPVTMRELADLAGLPLSRASAQCDHMVESGLIARSVDPRDSKRVTLSLTYSGQRVVETVMRRRWAEIEPVLARMTPSQRRNLASALSAFSEAAHEVSERDLWAMGWTT